MVKFIRNHIPFLIMSTILFGMIVFLITTSILMNNVQIAELWTRTIGRNYLKVMGKINDSLPLSLTEFSLIVVVISCVMYLAWGFCLLRNKKPWDFIHRVMMITMIVVGAFGMYNVSVGFAYHREKLPLEGYKGEIKKEDFVQIASYFAQDYSNCIEQLGVDDNGEIVLPYSKDKLITKVRSELDKLNDDYFNEYTPNAHPVLFSGMMTSVGVVGMYYGVLGEANYNTYSTNAELPFYVAHEMAHGKGVMREDDAQMVAFYACINSDDPLLRYSAYLNTFDRLLDITRLTGNKDDYNKVRGLISNTVWKNHNYIYYHWEGKMFLYDFGNQVNDWYLKTFGQKEGTESYNDTPTEVDPSERVISLSHYQSIYFKIYYDRHG